MTHPDSEREACMTLEQLKDWHERESFRSLPRFPDASKFHDRAVRAIDHHLTTRAHADARGALPDVPIDAEEVAVSLGDDAQLVRRKLGDDSEVAENMERAAEIIYSMIAAMSSTPSDKAG
jgi:hypothetical protein